MAGSPVVHFEIGCKDLLKSKEFYASIFGWTPTPIGTAADIATNSTEGIQGHITALGHEPHQYVTFYIQVDDITGTLHQIVASGGSKIIGPILLPNGSKFAWFKDPEGNMLGLTTKPA